MAISFRLTYTSILSFLLLIITGGICFHSELKPYSTSQSILLYSQGSRVVLSLLYFTFNTGERVRQIYLNLFCFSFLS